MQKYARRGIFCDLEANSDLQKPAAADHGGMQNTIQTAADLKKHLSSWWAGIQRSLFPELEEELGPLTEPLQRVVQVLEVLRFETHIDDLWCGVGRPPKCRVAIARAFTAKSTLNLSSTRALLDRLHCDPVLRRLCGFENRRDLPSESVLSRVFAEFAQTRLPQRVHAALIRKTHQARIVGHISRDSTAIEAREKPVKKEKPSPKPKRRRGRPRKDEEVVPKEPSRLEKQRTMTLHQMLDDLPKDCDVGAKRNSKGHQTSWIGYKYHVDSADGQVPISAILTSASVHDSQVALPLATMSNDRTTSLYDLMDAAYDSEEIKVHSRSLGHVPLIDENPRRNKARKQELADEARRQKRVGITPPEKLRYNERSGAERVNARLKDEFGGRHVRVKSHAKVACHLGFGLAALTADQLMRFVQ